MHFILLPPIRVNTQLARLICDLSAGEIIQNKEIYTACCDVDEYYERIAWKTANFIAVSCQLGGDVAGLDEKFIDALYEYGYCIGMFKYDRKGAKSDSGTCS